MPMMFRSFMKLIVLIVLAMALTSCGTKKVLVKKDSCKDVYDGALLECEMAEK